MTQSVQELLETFDRLADAEKREAAAAILERFKSLAFDLPSDEELVLNAERLFLELDRQELADGNP